MKKNLGGPPSIFTPKIGPSKGGRRFGGYLTKIGATQFEQARRRLAKLAGWDVKDTSDADTVEAAMRGWPETEAYLQTK